MILHQLIKYDKSLILRQIIYIFNLLNNVQHIVKYMCKTFLTVLYKSILLIKGSIYFATSWFMDSALHAPFTTTPNF